MADKLIAVLSLLILLGGCSISTLSVRMASPLVESQYAAINEESDLLLAEHAIPASLKMLEGLLREDPDNAIVLSQLAEGYCGYAFSFAEDTDPERASRLYLRGRDFAERLLILSGAPENLTRQNPEEFKQSVQALNADHRNGLFWMSQCWASWLMLNLDDLQAFVAMPKVETAMQRMLELDASYHYAGPHLFFGVFYGGRPKMLGGNPDKARQHFDLCLKLVERKYLIAQLLYAKIYAVQVQDRELFKKLLNEVLEAPADILPEQRLANAVAKMKAQTLLETADELF